MHKWKRLLTRDANILLKYLVIQGVMRGPRFVLPDWKGIRNHFWTWHKGETGINYLYQDLQQFSEVVLQNAMRDKTFAQRYERKSKVICDQVVKNIVRISQDVQPILSSDRLGRFFSQFCSQYERLGETIVMTLEEVQGELLVKLHDPQHVGVLTVPATLSIEAQEELDRLRLIFYIKSKYARLFRHNLADLKNKLEKLPQLKRKILAHVEKYGWLPLNFEKQIWDIDFFLHQFQSYLKHPYKYRARIKELEQYPQKRRRERARVMRGLDSRSRIVVQLLSATAYIRLYRASIFSLAFYRAFPLLREIGRRVGVPLEILKYYTPPEIRAALRSGQRLSAKKGQLRKQSFAILILNGRYAQYEGKAAEKMLDHETPQEEIPEMSVVKGMCAFPGIIKGRIVLLFDAREARRIRRGDILVCKETNPDLVIAMRHAGAIITDEGGLTSHAAIVSREMRKPCIIGTKIATRVLKDGDRVEVDATLGIVRKL